MSKKERQGPRKPATKMPNLQRKLQKQKLQVNKPSAEEEVTTQPFISAPSAAISPTTRRATEAGIDAILTDHPLELRAALSQFAASDN